VTLSPAAVDAPTLDVALEAAYRDHASAPAVIAPSGTWTYDDLHAHAQTIAAGVRAAAVFTPQRPPVVATVLDRSPEFVATVLGILAAGAVYLPLDPDAPDSYLGQVFAEARPGLVITAPDRAGRLRAVTSAPVLAYPDLIGQPGNGPGAGGVAPSDPAYVIYTSGSTGTPKGVLVSHTALLNSTAARVDRYGPAGRVLLLHSPAFDVATGVLFWTLLTGGTLIVGPARLADVAATVALIHRHQVTHLIYPASLYGVFLDRAAAAPPTCLTAVGIGSERWSPVLIGRHAALLPGVSLVNEYGPTEACVCSSYALLYDADTGEQAPMSIGRPVRDTGYLLLDGDGQPTDGSGELAITGANLALGYLERPELTAQRFVTIGAERAYRTGDLVEQDADGNFVFLERADRQLQIGGHRVEPGHVETVLMGHPAVLQVHVTTRIAPGGAGSAALTAYVVPLPGTEPLGDAYDRYLRDRLPAYLLPTRYVVLPDLPRTPSGKIDHDALPDPSVAVEASTEAVDLLQERLAATAAGILGVPQLGPGSSLRAVGADSLSLIRLAAMIATEHGVDVPISALFSAATIAQVADLVRGAAPAARMLPTATAAVAGSGVGYPLSGQQRQIWVLTRLAPHALAYSTQFSLLLDGPVDVAALEQALTEIVGRHEILRTTFHDGPDGPVQVVHDPWPAVVDVTDLTTYRAQDQDAALAERMRAAVGAGFDVAQLPLVRWHLFRLGPQVWRLLQVEHHFAHDGWSAQLFLAELRDAYAAIVAGRLPELPELPVQYRDFATWYQGWRDTADHAGQVAYWRQQLDGCPAEGVTFIADRSRPASRTFGGDRLSAYLPATVVRRLDELAGRHGVTRFAVFLAGFALQVWRHTGEQDIVVGSALVNRRQPGTERLLGMFVNALPLRVRIDPDAGVDALLHATVAVLLGAQDHQELPLLDLLAGIGTPRDPGRNPLFQLMFAFHDTPRPRLQMGSVQARLVIEHNATAKGDINVVCVPDPDGGQAGMTILWEYDTDLFDRDTAAGLLAGFETVLAALAREAGQPGSRPVRDLDLLGADETARLLALGTGPTDPVPFNLVHAGVDAAVAAHPDAVAVEHAGTRWTYRQLAERTARLQRHLTCHDVEPGAVVAITCPAGLDLITAVLATLRCGASYVCLDPDQPAARTTTMLADAHATVLVTTRTAASTTATTTGTPQDLTVLYADDLPDDPPPAAAGTAGPRVGPDDPAYLVYTSGSTGTPKAVVATHRNACTAIHARTRFLIQAGTGTGAVRTLVTLPVIFDVAPHMIMWTLWSGGTVVIPDQPTQVHDPEQVLDLIAGLDVTHVNFTASYYRHLLSAVPDGWTSALRVVAVGGEACRPDDVTAHADRLPGVALDHEYGPTEATVWCSARRLHPAGPDGPARVSVGSPLTNYTLTVLDQAGQLLPTGAVGELFIGGDGVAAGYHQRPELTADGFVTPGAGPLAGRRLYRTGDRARLTRAGFEILGRLDDQVKIRGFRVELGEISGSLVQHPDVTDAAVLVHGAADTARLVAYIAAPVGHGGLGDRLRAWLAQRLPAYMIPAAYVITDRLPRTATGKLQTSDLPDLPGLPEPAGHEPGHGPATDQQWLLAQVWRDVLQRPTLGIDDDFFACGGDSLQAIQAAARITALGVPVSAADLISAPTIRALDVLLSTRLAADTIAVADRRPAGTELELTPIQVWFFQQQFADPDHFHQARLFTIPTHCDHGRLRAALQWVIARHDAFRTRFVHAGSTWTALLDERARPDLVHERLLPPNAGPSPDRRLDEVLRGLHHTISIGDGRLAAFTIVTEPDSDHAWLYLIAHHLIVDVVSWQILAADLEQAYQMLTDGRQLPDGTAPGLPARDHPPAGRPNPARWQALAAVAKPRLGAATTLAPATTGERLRIQRRLSARAGTYLRLDVPRLHGIGAQAVLLAALRRAVSPYTIGVGLYVWLEGHGRTQRGAPLDQVVGWLTSLHPALFTVDDTQAARLVDPATSIHHQITAEPDPTGYGETVLRHPGSALHRQLAATGLPQITVNYLGWPAENADRLLQPVPGPDGATIGGGNVLPTPFDVTVAPAPDGTVTCHLSIDPAVLPAADVARVADRFAAELETAARLIPLTAAPIRHPARTLFLIHPVGGLVDWYTHLVAGLGPGWDCYGIPRDRTGDDTTLPALAAGYLTLIRAAKPTGRYTLAGWCLGGPLAYEIARQAQTDGDIDRIDDVILMDPPRAERPRNPHDVLVAHIHNACPHQTRAAVVDALTASEDLPTPDRAAALVDRLGTAGPGQPDHPLHSQLLMRLADHAAMSAWQPTGQIPHLTLYLPQTATPDNANAAATWRSRADAVTVLTVPGDHESMLTTDDLRDGVAGHADPAATTDGRR
jgi:amino acid adenylation domain-containing protein